MHLKAALPIECRYSCTDVVANRVITVDNTDDYIGIKPKVLYGLYTQLSPNYNL